MSDWAVLDLRGDPAPGDPARVRELAAQLRRQAEQAERNASRLRSLASEEGSLRMEGDYAPKFREALSDLPAELSKLAKAYRGCGAALVPFASSLEQAKAKAGGALRQGKDCDTRYQGAMRQLQYLLPPDRQPMLTSSFGLSPAGFEAATAGLDEAIKAEARAAVDRARSARNDADVARRMADQAAQLRGDAESRCEKGIREALKDSGIKNKSWWKKAWDAVSAPFRSWDEFVKLCSKVAMVAGVVALFVSGPIGWALMAAAVVAGGVVLANTLNKYSKGQAGLLDVGLDLLGVIPGGRGVTSVARLGRGAVGMMRSAKTVGGPLLKSGARQVRRALPALRSGITNMRQKAVPLVKRWLGFDPVDMVTGEVVLEQTDVELPGLLPLLLTRTHVSSYHVGRWFGSSWASTLDQRLEIDPVGACLATADGMLLVYPLPTTGGVLPHEGPPLELARTGGGYTVADPESGLTSHFASVAGCDAGVLPLVAISNRSGHRIDLIYGEGGALSEVRHSGGYRVGVEVADGRITALHLRDRGTGADPTLLRYRYEGGRLTEVINSSGLPLRFNYDEAGRLLCWEDRNGTRYAYTYDDHGRCVRTEGSEGALDGTVSYDSEDRVTVATDSLGATTAFHLNEANQIVAEVNSLGHSITSEWDQRDHLVARTDALGRTTRWEYDPQGNVVAVTRPDGSRATAAYNELGLPVVTVEPDGAEWRLAYDEHGNLMTATDPAGATTTYTYDDRGRLRAVTDALDQTTLVETDDAGLPVATTDPTGATTRYDRDAFGRVIAVTDPLGAITHLAYSIEGKLTSRTLADGTTETWAYDGEGNLVEHVDAMGQATTMEATHFDLPAARTGPDGARLEFAYDTELRLSTVTNPQGLVWRYEYGPTDNLTSETDFNGRRIQYRHDAAGQLVERVNGAGEATRFTWDLVGNLVEKRAGDALTSFAYDLAGRLVQAANADAECSFERDALGRVLAETCNGRTVASRYDPLGRRVHRQTPSGAESEWTYDARSLPETLRAGGRTLRFAHDVAGREIERQLPGAGVLTQTWDATYQLLSQTLTAQRPQSARDARLVQHRAYRYRPDGHIVAIEDRLAGVRRFDLDRAGRVTAVQADGWTERYAYDPAGNLTDADWPAQGGDSLAEDAQGEREYAGTMIRRAGRVRYEHDAQGRVTLRQQKRLSGKPRSWRYSWDAEDRLTGVTTPDGHRWRYRYDALGRRVAKERLASDESTVVEEVTFAWDGALVVEQIHSGAADDADSATTVWDWEPDSFRPVSQRERRTHDLSQAGIDERFYAIVDDLVGMPRELVQEDGEVAWHLRTNLWGDGVAFSPYDVDCPLRFPGQYFDSETQLNYNFYRHYEPTTARYESSDPIGLAGGAGIHSYVSNSLVLSDPLGLAPYRIRSGTALVRAADFADDATAFKHYAKHVKGIELRPNGGYRLKRGGADMPEFGSFAEYRDAARSFMSPEAPSGVLQGYRGTDLVRVDPKSGYFGVRSESGAIRTFFQPDGDPVSYFKDQF